VFEGARRAKADAPERLAPNADEPRDEQPQAAVDSAESIPAVDVTSEQPTDAPAAPALQDGAATLAPVITASLPPRPALVPVPQATATSAGPRRLASKLGHRQLLTNPSSNALHVPAALRQSGQTFTATLDICVDARGEVSKVSVLRSAGPALDPQIVEQVSRWKYRPLVEAGTAAPFCYPMNYQVAPE
jgi:TonB family protein